MEQPAGFIDPQPPHLVYNLQKSLYSLKQAPRAWFEKLYTALIQLGFTSVKTHQSPFIKITKEFSIFVLVYVDDILVTGINSQLVQAFIDQLNQQYALKDLGDLDYFLAIQVKRTSIGFHLSQTKLLLIFCVKQRCSLPRVNFLL